MAKRRSAADWAKLMQEFERSGQTATEFARPRGIRPDTLKWWRWQLGRQTRSKAIATAMRSLPRPAARVKLLAVRPVPDGSPRDRQPQPQTPVWELVSPTGHELRVYDRRGLSVLRAALFAVAGSRRR